MVIFCVVIIIIAFLIGAPIAIVLGGAGLAAVVLGGYSLTVVVSRMYTGLESFPLLAIPLFMMLGPPERLFQILSLSLLEEPMTT